MKKSLKKSILLGIICFSILFLCILVWLIICPYNYYIMLSRWHKGHNNEYLYHKTILELQDYNNKRIVDVLLGDLNDDYGANEGIIIETIVSQGKDFLPNIINFVDEHLGEYGQFPAKYENLFKQFSGGRPTAVVDVRIHGDSEYSVQKAEGKDDVLNIWKEWFDENIDYLSVDETTYPLKKLYPSNLTEVPETIARNAEKKNQTILNYYYVDVYAKSCSISSAKWEKLTKIEQQKDIAKCLDMKYHDLVKLKKNVIFASLQNKLAMEGRDPIVYREIDDEYLNELIAGKRPIGKSIYKYSNGTKSLIDLYFLRRKVRGNGNLRDRKEP